MNRRRHILSQTPPQYTLFGVGPARTGTRCLAACFAPPIRAAHEPEAAALLALLRARHEGDLSEVAWRAALRERAARLALDVDVAHANYFLLDVLLDEFPDSRFVLTWRNPRDWLESFINHQFAHPHVGDHWRWLRELRFRPAEHPHTIWDAALQTRGLYALDGYLAYYARHLREVRTKVAPARLLTLRTEALDQANSAIARFAGIDGAYLRTRPTSRNEVAHTTTLPTLLDPNYLADRIAWHCGPGFTTFP